MQSIDLIRDNLEKSRDRVPARIEEMQEYCVVFPTPKGGDHTLWVLGHLAYIEALVIREALAEPNPLAEWEELKLWADLPSPSGRPAFGHFKVTRTEHRLDLTVWTRVEIWTGDGLMPPTDLTVLNGETYREPPPSRRVISRSSSLNLMAVL